MPIPEWNSVGVLPPIFGNGTDTHERSPWPCTLLEFAERFCTSSTRQGLILGLLRYREVLRSRNVTGVQWIDGSFVEDCESRRGKPPGDIDVVTVFATPEDVDPGAFARALDGMFTGHRLKPRFGCDAYAIILDDPPLQVARWAAYWSGLFSHAKIDNAHKGICEISLTADPNEDAAALAFLTQWSAPDA